MIVHIFFDLHNRFLLGAQLFAAAIFFIDVILNDFDHARSKQFLFYVYIRLLVINDCSYGGIDRPQQGLGTVRLPLLLQSLLYSPYSFTFGVSAFKLFGTFLTIHHGQPLSKLILESGVFLIFHEVCVNR